MKPHISSSRETNPNSRIQDSTNTIRSKNQETAKCGKIAMNSPTPALITHQITDLTTHNHQYPTENQSKT